MNLADAPTIEALLWKEAFEYRFIANLDIPYTRPNTPNASLPWYSAKIRRMGDPANSGVLIAVHRGNVDLFKICEAILPELRKSNRPSMSARYRREVSI